MTDGVYFEIRGLEKALANMRALPVLVRNKVANSAMRKAAILVRDAARANAQRIDRTETPLKIADNIDARYASRTSKRTGDVIYQVGVRGGAKAYGNTKRNRGKKRVGEKYDTGGSTYYWRFVELGTSRSRARPFMLPALERNTQAATDAFVAEFDRQIARALKKSGV